MGESKTDLFNQHQCTHDANEVRKMNQTIRIYMIAPCSEALGPYKRFIVWVQGCNKRCKGCIAPDSWALDGGELIDVEVLADQIIMQENIEGITISGGEPFLQQQALCSLISTVRKQKNIGVIIYTGMNYSDIKDTDLAKMSDIIVDGEYREELNDDKSLRGSSNQNIICRTERYKSIIAEHYGINGRKIELLFSSGKLQMIGIPNKKLGEMVGG